MIDAPTDFLRGKLVELKEQRDQCFAVLAEHAAIVDQINVAIIDYNQEIAQFELAINVIDLQKWGSRGQDKSDQKPEAPSFVKGGPSETGGEMIDHAAMLDQAIKSTSPVALNEIVEIMGKFAPSAPETKH